MKIIAALIIAIGIAAAGYFSTPNYQLYPKDGGPVFLRLNARTGEVCAVLVKGVGSEPYAHSCRDDPWETMRKLSGTE